MRCSTLLLIQRNLITLGMLCILSATPAGADPAGEILRAAGVRGGLVVHIGCADGTLTSSLRANDGYLVHGLDTDPANVAKARENILATGDYGNVAVDRFDGKHLPYTDNLVNLVVCEDLGGLSMDEVMRVLAPGGVACIQRSGKWVKTVKPRPAEMDEWTHFLHAADNNATADDTLVGPPRHFQWICGPRHARSHDHLATVSALVSAGGRIFYIIDEGSTACVGFAAQWSLVARDAFSGVLLWKHPVGPWEGHLRDFRSGPAELPRRLVAVGDTVYVTLGYGAPITALDAATGKQRMTYAGSENTLEIIRHQDVLIAVVGDRTPDNTDGAAVPNEPEKVWHWWPIYEETPPKKHLAAFDANTGKLLWKKSDADVAQLMPTTLAASAGRVFFENTKEVIALDLTSAEELWKTSRPVSRRRMTWSTPTLAVYGDVVLSADRSTTAPPPEGPTPDAPISEGDTQWVVSSLGGNAPRGELIALDVATGKKLWSCECRESYNSPPDVLVADGIVWTGDLTGSRDPGVTVGRDVKTGEILKRRPRDQSQFRIGMGHHRCYRNKATSRYLVLGRDGIEFIDLATGVGQAHAWVRSACQYGVMPCNGLVYAAPHSCACHVESLLSGFNALAPKREGPKPPRSPQLEKGPAFGQGPGDHSSSDTHPSSFILHHSEDWPTYRRDAARSGVAESTVPAKLTPAWRTGIGGKLSAPVVSGGKLLVARIDAHTVHALDAGKGSKLWHFTAGGRVDSPPTIAGSMAVFGCADGCIYCLRLADGTLVWRFRAVPQTVNIVSYGQVESAWPVHGSVLIRDGVVYAVAGRSSNVDGGLRLVRLALATGERLSLTTIDSRRPGVPPAMPDVLSCDGSSVFLRHRRFDLSGNAQQTLVPHLYSSAGFLDDSWWHRTYWLLGSRMSSGWGSWPNSALQAPAGRLMIRDGSKIYGFGRHQQHHRHGAHVGLGRTQYRLFACTAKPKATTGKRGGSSPQALQVEQHWSRRVPLYVRAMALSGDTLLVAGPPDVIPEAEHDVQHPYYIADPAALVKQEAALAGAHGAVLWAVSASDGKRQAVYRLQAMPAWDAMAIAEQRLFLCLTDGAVRCWK